MIPFNRPHTTGKELGYVQSAIEGGQTAGNGPFTRKCQAWLEEHTTAKKALLTHSCTAALEMCAILLDVGPGDEVIMPSYTFVSTANAFVLRGAVPVFVDIDKTTLNILPGAVESAITEKTRAICVVHYAGVGCDMERLAEISERHGVPIIEDAAHAAMASYHGKPLGSFGALSTFSFHETKNLISGEGGALLINDESLVPRAEVVWEKGTNRSAFFRGEVDKYTWVDVGSSFLPGEIVAAFLWAQLEEASDITSARLELWRRYNDAFADAEACGLLQRPEIPQGCEHNAHMYYVLVPDLEARSRVLAQLKEAGFMGVFHYVPLHSSPAGQRFGRVEGAMHNTDAIWERVVRLPLWVGLDGQAVDAIADSVVRTLNHC